MYGALPTLAAIVDDGRGVPKAQSLGASVLININRLQLYLNLCTASRWQSTASETCAACRSIVTFVSPAVLLQITDCNPGGRHH